VIQIHAHGASPFRVSSRSETVRPGRRAGLPGRATARTQRAPTERFLGRHETNARQAFPKRGLIASPRISPQRPPTAAARQMRSDIHLMRPAPLSHRRVQGATRAARAPYRATLDGPMAGAATADAQQSQADPERAKHLALPSGRFGIATALTGVALAALPTGLTPGVPVS
jgi:hypothetical protein